MIITETNSVCYSKGPNQGEHCAHHGGKDLCKTRKKTRVIGHYELRNENNELWFVPS